jgi:hypothetical protein
MSLKRRRNRGEEVIGTCGAQAQRLRRRDLLHELAASHKR